MSWKERFFDPIFNEGKKESIHDIEDFILKGDRVVGTRGGYRGRRGYAVDNQYDWMGTDTVKIKWDDGGAPEGVPCDCLTRT